MNRTSLIAQFRTEMHDLVEPYLWGDDEVTDLYTEAEAEACIRARLIREKENPDLCRIDVTEGVSTYALDPRVVEIVFASMVYPEASGLPYILGRTTSETLDQVRPYWRTQRYRPTALIHYDTSVEFDCLPDTAYTVNLEVYRLPMLPIGVIATPAPDPAVVTDTPEINPIHHRHLVKWVKHRAYQKHDVDGEAMALSEKYLAEFEDVFGKRPTAAQLHGRNTNKPHRNRCW